MDPGQVLAVARRRWWVLVATAALGAAGGAAHTVATTPQFEATTTTFFSLSGGESVGDLAEGSVYTQDLVQSYAQLARLPIVLTPVAEDLGLSEDAAALAERVAVDAPLNTAIMRITVTDTSATQAAGIADAVADSLADAVGDLAPQRGDAGLTVEVTTVEPAATPTAPSWPLLPLDLAVGVVLGLGVGTALALVLEVLATPVASRAVVGRLTPAPVLGSIVRDPHAGRRPVPTRSHPHESRAESYRVLRTNLRFLQGTRDVGCVVVTSALAGEGKTSTAVNLAVSMADAGARVLLADADLRRPRVATALGLEGAAGLSTVLVGDATVDDVVQRWGDPGVDVLAAGSEPPNPSELLASGEMERLLTKLRGRYDLVVLDSPPLLPVTDGAALAAACDGAVLVVDSRRTQQRHVVEALGRLRMAGAATLGVVLNRVPDDGRYYGPADAAPRRARLRRGRPRRRR